MTLTVDQLTDRLTDADRVSPVTPEFGTAIMRQDLNPHPPRKWGLSMSALGVCRRQAAYLDAGVEPSDPDEGTEAAAIGTWIHDGWLPHAQKGVPGSIINHPVMWLPFGMLQPPVPGTLDMAWLGWVLDLKTMSEWKQERFILYGPEQSHRWQAHGYGEARRQDGHDVKMVQVFSILRANGRTASYVEEHTPEVVAEMTAWVDESRHYATTDPDQAPRDQRGPGVSKACDWCPFLRRCWGDDARPEQIGKGQQVFDDYAVREAVKLYAAASAKEKEAKTEKDWAKAMIGDAPAGIYGDFKLRYQRAGGRKAAVDADVAAYRLEQAGIEVPYTDGAPGRKGPRVSPIRGKSTTTSGQEADD